MRILIVEDDREAASYLGKALAAAGHVADLAHDGEAGERQAHANPYDVLVVDRMLLKKDGVAMIEGLRKAGERTPVPWPGRLKPPRRPFQRSAAPAPVAPRAPDARR